jgi:hypothetical protein
VALLVVYEPGFKFKYNKYYLRKGNNLIGSDPNSQVPIASATTPIPPRIANLRIGDDLTTLEPLVNKSVFVPSNMVKRNDLMVELESGTKYVI